MPLFWLLLSIEFPFSFVDEQFDLFIGLGQGRRGREGLPFGGFTIMATNGSKEQLFEEVSATCTGLITRIALSYENDAALRRELVQDILLAIWIALDSYRGDASLKTFAASIAQKRCISHVSKRAREPRQVELSPDLVSAAPAPDEEALRNEQRRRLVDSIQHLPIPQREAIVLCFEGFSYAEMADILGISANAVMLRCQRAKAALKSMMERRS